jgi:hypothetical protein
MWAPAQIFSSLLGRRFSAPASANERTAPNAILAGAFPADGRDEWRAASHDDCVSILTPPGPSANAGSASCRSGSAAGRRIDRSGDREGARDSGLIGVRADFADQLTSALRRPGLWRSCGGLIDASLGGGELFVSGYNRHCEAGGPDLLFFCRRVLTSEEKMNLSSCWNSAFSTLRWRST